MALIQSIKNLAPIVLFVYSRPLHTKKTIDSLQKNSIAAESELIIYSDASKNEATQESVVEVRKLIKNVTGFKKVTIIERMVNWGLAASIIDGVTATINQHGKVIVLEDDLITSPYFLTFMNEALDFYQNDKDIYSVTGFNFSSTFMHFPSSFLSDIFLNIRPMSWSWATWEKEWHGIDWDVNDFNEFISSKQKVRNFNKGGTDLSRMLEAQMNGQLDSWYIRWCYNAFKKKKFTIYPKVSLVNNIGHDNTGVHCRVDSKNIYSHSELSVKKYFEFEQYLELNQVVVSNFNKAFNVPLLARVKGLVKRVLKW